MSFFVFSGRTNMVFRKCAANWYASYSTSADAARAARARARAPTTEIQFFVQKLGQKMSRIFPKHHASAWFWGNSSIPLRIWLFRTFWVQKFQILGVIWVNLKMARF